MSRIAGVELQDSWKVDYALTRIAGLGWTLSKKMIAELGIDATKRVRDLTPEEISKISGKMEEIPTEGELARIVRGNIQRLHSIGSYRGIRHGRGLPVRGQRTKTNARTKRGKRKTVGAFKKEVLAAQKSAKDTAERVAGKAKK
jgi:small subunit ribosomal protein S13